MSIWFLDSELSTCFYHVKKMVDNVEVSENTSSPGI